MTIPMTTSNPQEEGIGNKRSEFNYQADLIEMSYGRQKLIRGKTYKFKICLIGDGGTGKTTYINKALNGIFTRDYVATIGANVKNLLLTIDENTRVIFEIWDTAGQEKYKLLGDGYYVNSSGAFVFCDLLTRESITNIQEHLKNFTNACGIEDAKMIICANKADIVKSSTSALRMIDKYKRTRSVDSIQISAKTGFNYTKPLISMTRYLFQDDKLEISGDLSLKPLDDDYDFLAKGDLDNSALSMANLNIEK